MRERKAGQAEQDRQRVRGLLEEALRVLGGPRK